MIEICYTVAFHLYVHGDIKLKLLDLFITAGYRHCLIYPDKLDLIHWVLSSIFSAMGLCHLIHVRTEWRYQLSYSGYKSSEAIEMCGDMGIDILLEWVLWTWHTSRSGRRLRLHWNKVLFPPICCLVCVVLLFPLLLGHFSILPLDLFLNCLGNSHTTVHKWWNYTSSSIN